MRVLTWNLKHGRAVPSAGRDLFDEFAAALGGWDWDLAFASGGATVVAIAPRLFG